jgi:hypothetical protein
MELKNDSDTPLTAINVAVDTTLDDTDAFGYNPGEPYLQVDIDGEEVLQTSRVERNSNYQTTLDIPQNTVNQLEEGEHSVTVILWDQDGDEIDDTDWGNDNDICKKTKTFTIENTVESGIHSVQITSTVDKDDDEFISSFSAEIQATTLLPDSDLDGQNPGEPYFQIDLGGETVATTDIVQREENGTFSMSISSENLQGYDRGQYPIEVELWDRDGDEIDDTDLGNDDGIDEWSGDIQIERPLQLRSSRSSTIVGSPVAFRITGVSETTVDWQLTDQPAESDVSIHTEYRHTVSFRPTEAGEYTLTANPEGVTATESKTIEVKTSDDYDLLKRYSPSLHFAAGETYYPTRYESFIYNARLQQFGEDNIPNPTVFELPGRELGA